jgi:hypothetical protein
VFAWRGRRDTSGPDVGQVSKGMDGGAEKIKPVRRSERSLFVLKNRLRTWNKGSTNFISGVGRRLACLARTWE